MLLVKDILEEIADHVGGHGLDINCSDEAVNKALKVFNESQRLLMSHGDFEGTDQEVCLEIYGGCITLDRRIETIKHYNLNGSPGTIQNNNFRYLQQGGGNYQWYSASVLQDIGDHFATFRDLRTPMYILAVSDRPELESAMLEVHGIDELGREVSRVWLQDKGYHVPIVEKSKAAQYTEQDANNSGKLSKILAIRKPRTSGYVYIYGWLPGRAPVWLNTMAPDEHTSQHRRYRIPGVAADQRIELQAKVSLRWVKQYPGDIAIVQNIDAFILMAKALNSRDSNEIGEYSHLRNSAVAELKLQRAKKHPAHTSTLNVKLSRRKIRNGSTRFVGLDVVRAGQPVNDGPCPVPTNTPLWTDD